jgi:hypothetical protein
MFFIQQMEYEQRVVVQFRCKERVSTEDIHACFEAQFGDGTSSEWSILWWCQNVRQEREDLDDKMRSARPPIDFLDIWILALLNEQPFDSANSIAETLSVSHSTILSYLREWLGMKIFIYLGSRMS